MRHLILILTMALFPQGAGAGETALRSLDTSDAGKGWDAVGRLDIGGAGFCTGSLIAPDVVLTAAHCLFDKKTGAPIRIETIEFLAGWRNGRASAYRYVRSAVLHPDYDYACARAGVVSRSRERLDRWRMALKFGTRLGTN